MEDGFSHFEDVKQGNDSIVEYVGPDKTLHKVMEIGTPVCHEYSDVLQEDRDLDRDHDWTVDS